MSLKNRPPVSMTTPAPTRPALLPAPASAATPAASAWPPAGSLPTPSRPTGDEELNLLNEWNLLDDALGTGSTAIQSSTSTTTNSVAMDVMNTPVVSDLDEDAAPFFAPDTSKVNTKMSHHMYTFVKPEALPSVPELVIEAELPVISLPESDANMDAFSSIWDMTHDQDSGHMVSCNPWEAEGRAQPASAPQPTEDDQTVVSKKNSLNLKLVMPPAAVKTEPTVEMAPAAAAVAVVPQQQPLDTPAVDSMLANDDAADGFDLLDYVTNSELPVDDPGFLALIGDTSPAPAAALAPSFCGSGTSVVTTIDVSAIQVEIQPRQEAVPVAGPSRAQPPKGKRRQIKKEQPPKEPKRRGRPPTAPSVAPPAPAALLRAATAADHAYDSASASDGGGGSIQDAKYRRMRDLNNAASKRCRQNRKRKFNVLQDEEDELREKNARLKAKAQQMDEMVAKLKKRFIDKVANPQRQPVDLDVLLQQHLSTHAE